MDKDWRNTGLLPPSFETPKNGLGPLEVISISLYGTPKNTSCSSSAQSDPQNTHGLEDDIGLRSEFLQFKSIVKGSESRLKSEFFKSADLPGRAEVDSDLVVGPFGVPGEVVEDGASNVT